MVVAKHQSGYVYMRWRKVFAWCPVDILLNLVELASMHQKSFSAYGGQNGWSREFRLPEMLHEVMLEADNFWISQVSMAALQKVLSTGCFKHPVVVDKATLDPLNASGFTQVIVT